MSGPAYTKGTLRTAVLQQADALNSDRWDITAGGEVDNIISDVFDDEWKRILNANPFYTYQQVLVNSDAVTGRVPVTSLTTGSGDTAQRFYRILVVIGPTDNIVYDPAWFTDIPLGETFAANVRVWYLEGGDGTTAGKIFILPKQLNTQFDFRTNWIPTRPGDLSADNVLIKFPADYQNILRYEAAAWLLTKGGAETPASAELRQFAESRRTAMLEDVTRPSIDADQVRYPDSRFEWGGS